MVLNSQLNEIQGSINTKHIRYSAVSSFIIWGLVLIKSIGSLLSSLSDSHPQVSSTKSRNWYLLCVIGLFTGLKGYSDLNHSSLRPQLSTPGFIEDAYHQFKNSSTWNKTNEYGGQAYDWAKNKSSQWYENTQQWAHQKVNTTEINQYKDKLIDEFDQWVSGKIDIQKFKNMSRTAKKALFEEFIDIYDIDE